MPSKKAPKGNPKPKARPRTATTKTATASEASTSKAKTVSASLPPKEKRLSQQQLERLERARRRQQQQTFGTIIAALVILGLIGGFIYFVTKPQTSPTASKPKATVSAVPTAPQVPPTVTGTPTVLPDGLQIIDIYVPPDPTANPTGTVTAGPSSTAGATASAGPTGTPTAKPTPIPVAKKGDTVDVQYTGWLQSTLVEFDSSYDHGGQPFEFTIGANQVIKGWDEGVVGMKVGGKRRLIIPAALGYGDQGTGDKIPPGATLIFDIELVSIKSGS